MNLIDANVLLYAVNLSDPKHQESRSWLDGAINGGETVAFAWIALLAFVRLSTKVGLFPRPLTVDAALGQAGEWLAQPGVVVLDPTPRHLVVMSGLLNAAGGTGANLVNDAHLAALAIEHGATVVTYDSDFGRFAGVRWISPLGA